MKKIFIEAHKMTREMVGKYKVDYQAQLGLNLSYLLNKEEEKEMLKGSKKQIKWAEKIREEMKKDFNYFEKEDKKVELMTYYKTFFILREATKEEIIETFNQLMSNKNAVWFIENRNTNIVELIVKKQNQDEVKNKIGNKIDLEKMGQYLKELKNKNKALRAYVKSLNKSEYEEFRNFWTSLDGPTKEAMWKMIK